ncbi:MAG: hypothetical protein ACYDHF_06270 [Candidatus Cryosericum sp.]
MSPGNGKKKYLQPGQVNFIQGLVKMRGFDSLALAARTRFPRSTIIANLNGDRANPLTRWAIAQVLKEPVHRLFPPGDDHKAPDAASKG